MSRTTLKGEAWLMKAQELLDLKKFIKDLQEKELLLVKEVQAMADNKPYQYKGVMSFYEQRKGSVNYSIIPELARVDLEVYRKPPVSIFKLVRMD